MKQTYTKKIVGRIVSDGQRGFLLRFVLFSTVWSSAFTFWSPTETACFFDRFPVIGWTRRRDRCWWWWWWCCCCGVLDQSTLRCQLKADQAKRHQAKDALSPAHPLRSEATRDRLCPSRFVQSRCVIDGACSSSLVPSVPSENYEICALEAITIAKLC